jgi:hypothetical protein
MMTFAPHKLFNSPRKVAAGVVVLAVGLLFWGRLMIQNVPRTAVADPERHTEAANGAEAGKPSASGGSEAAKSSQIPADD